MTMSPNCRAVTRVALMIAADLIGLTIVGAVIPPRCCRVAVSNRRRPMNQTIVHFHAGQRVLCVDASPNQRYGIRLPMLRRGGIYVIRAIDQRPDWQAPGWGVHVEGMSIVHPDAGCEWAMKPGRFRPVVERPTNIEIFRKLLAGAPTKEPRPL